MFLALATAGSSGNSEGETFWLPEVGVDCTNSLSVLSCHGAGLCCTEQSVQSADSRDSTGRLDKENVPQTKSARTRPVFFSMDFFWSMVHGPQ